MKKTESKAQKIARLTLERSVISGRIEEKTIELDALRANLLEVSIELMTTYEQR